MQRIDVLLDARRQHRGTGGPSVCGVIGRLPTWTFTPTGNRIDEGGGWTSPACRRRAKGTGRCRRTSATAPPRSPNTLRCEGGRTRLRASGRPDGAGSCGDVPPRRRETPSRPCGKNPRLFPRRARCRADAGSIRDRSISLPPTSWPSLHTKSGSPQSFRGAATTLKRQAPQAPPGPCFTRHGHGTVPLGYGMQTAQVGPPAK